MNQENGLLYNCQLALNSQKDRKRAPLLPEAPWLTVMGSLRGERASQGCRNSVFGMRGPEVGAAEYDLRPVAELPEDSDHRLCKKVIRNHPLGKHRSLGKPRACPCPFTSSHTPASYEFSGSSSTTFSTLPPHTLFLPQGLCTCFPKSDPYWRVN